MKNKLHKINILTAAVIAAVLFLAFMISLMAFLSTDFNQYDNQVRLLVQKRINTIEKGEYKKGNYPYIVFNLEGRVLYADLMFDTLQGDKINVQEMLQYDKSFANKYPNYKKESFILQKNGRTNGFVVFLIQDNQILINTSKNRAAYIFLPMAAGILLSIAIIVCWTLFCKYRMLMPLKEISASAKGIIAGNYDLEVLRTYWKSVDENEVGDLSYAFELMRDELKSKQIREEALKKSQKELISCISHDLKTPISTIKAYSEGLRDHIAKSPEDQAEYIGIIINKTDLLISMINELLECSTAQLNQLDIMKEELYFKDYFSPLMFEIQVYVEQNGYQLSYSRNLPELLVAIDKKRITEVIYNLIENSMKYMNKKNGSIEITAAREDQFMLITVRDNGPGISADDIPYVFDMFYRAEKSRSSSIPGSGLGLSICKYIINEHGGEIYCRSSSFQGCEIGFTLPLI